MFKPSKPIQYASGKTGSFEAMHKLVSPYVFTFTYVSVRTLVAHVMSATVHVCDGV